MSRLKSYVTRGMLVALGACSAILSSEDAGAQVPPHSPGTVCATPQFWCWAPQPGYPGTVCCCPSPYGWIQGVLI
jgi:hypothetical protein